MMMECVREEVTKNYIKLVLGAHSAKHSRGKSRKLIFEIGWSPIQGLSITVYKASGTDVVSLLVGCQTYDLQSWGSSSG